MPHERCAECGFDSDDWTDRAALQAIGELPDRWEAAVSEVLFAMRFVAESALTSPGLDLGPTPESEFTPAPRTVDLSVALSGVRYEANGLVSIFEPLTDEQWLVTAEVGPTTIDLHWVARHAVHDATHHLYDLETLRAALPEPDPGGAPSGSKINRGPQSHRR